MRSLVVLAKYVDIDKYNSFRKSSHALTLYIWWWPWAPLHWNLHFCTANKEDAPPMNDGQTTCATVRSQIHERIDYTHEYFKSMCMGRVAPHVCTTMNNQHNPQQVSSIHTILANNSTRYHAELLNKCVANADINSYTEPVIWEHPRVSIHIDSYMHVVLTNTAVIHDEPLGLSYDLIAVDDSESVCSNFDEGQRVINILNYVRAYCYQ